MIKEEIIHKCPKCESTKIVKNGKHKMQQQYKCKECNSYGTINPIVKYNEAEKEKILKAYQERQSMRGIKRTFGVAIPTLIEWLKKKRK